MTEERINELERRVAALTQAVTFHRGKVIGLEAALLTLARQWGYEPQKVIEALHETMEVLDDPSKNSPQFSGVQKEEAIRLVEQVSSALHSRNR